HERGRAGRRERHRGAPRGPRRRGALLRAGRRGRARGGARARPRRRGDREGPRPARRAARAALLGGRAGARARGGLSRGAGPAGRAGGERSVSRIAIVHDWLTGQRGGENVLEEVLALLPGADLYTIAHVPGSVRPSIEARRPRTTWVSYIPVVRRSPGVL